MWPQPGIDKVGPNYRQSFTLPFTTMGNLKKTKNNGIQKQWQFFRVDDKNQTVV